MRSQSPVVHWQAVASQTAGVPPAPPRARMVGAILGTVVGLMFVLAPWTWEAFRGTLEFPMSSVGPDLAGPAAIVIAGTAGGAILGPAGWQARGFLKWAEVVGALALLAIPIGALVIGEATAMSGVGRTESPSLSWTFAPFVGLLLAGLGTAIFGLFVFPFTLAASLIWAIAMRLVTSWAGAKR
jgi:hypothetical protein